MLAYASTSTLLTITKTTTLRGKDANEFVHLFGKYLEGNNTFIYICKKGKCQIAATKDGFRGKLAEKILHQRKAVKFVSKDKRFVLACGRTSVAYCSVIQKNAILS